MGTSSPEVTVVIPTRNRWSWLAAAVSSSLRQVDVDVRVVVVDDGSTHPPPEVPVFQHHRVQWHRLAESVGVAKARNAGARLVQTPWTVFRDDDDLWSPEKLRIQIDTAENSGSQYAYVAAVGVNSYFEPIAWYPAPDPSALLREMLKRNAMPCPGSNVLMRTELLTGGGRFDESFEHLDDWDMWIRLAAKAQGQACLLPLAAYVIHIGNRISSEHGSLEVEIQRLAEKHELLSKAHDQHVDLIDFSRWVGKGLWRSGRNAEASSWYLRTGLRYRSPGNIFRAAAVLVRTRPYERTSRQVQAPDWLHDEADESRTIRARLGGMDEQTGQ